DTNRPRRRNRKVTLVGPRILPAALLEAKTYSRMGQLTDGRGALISSSQPADRGFDGAAAAHIRPSGGASSSTASPEPDRGRGIPTLHRDQQADPNTPPGRPTRRQGLPPLGGRKGR